MKQTQIKIVIIAICVALLAVGGVLAANNTGQTQKQAESSRTEEQTTGIEQELITPQESLSTQAVGETISAEQGQTPQPTVMAGTPVPTQKAAQTTPKPTARPTQKAAQTTPKPTTKPTAKSTPTPTVKPTEPTPAPTAKPTEEPQKEESRTVYWTPSGEKWHVSKNCPTLSRSKKIYSGSVSEAKAKGKDALCKVCG